MLSVPGVRLSQGEAAAAARVREVAYDLERRVRQELAYPNVVHFYTWLLQGAPPLECCPLLTRQAACMRPSDAAAPPECLPPSSAARCLRATALACGRSCGCPS